MVGAGDKRIDSFNRILIIQKRNCRPLIHLNLVISHCLQAHLTTDFTDILVELRYTDYVIQSEGNYIHSSADSIAVTLTLSLSNSLGFEAVGSHNIILSKAFRIVIAKHRLIGQIYETTLAMHEVSHENIGKRGSILNRIRFHILPLEVSIKSAHKDGYLRSSTFKYFI